MARHACSTASRLDPFGPLRYGQPAVVAVFPKLQVARMIGSGMGGMLQYQGAKFIGRRYRK